VGALLRLLMKTRGMKEAVESSWRHVLRILHNQCEVGDV
jgi:hypothetical protein